MSFRGIILNTFLFQKFKPTNMQKQKTIYHLIVDKSGSMSDCIPQTINGFNEQVSKIRELQQQYPEQELSIGLTTFSHDVFEHFYQSKPEMVKRLNTDTYIPDGSTALLDAVGITVKHIEEQVQYQTSDSDTTVVVVILTDGEENASKNYTLSQIKSMISRLQETGKWTFSFLGANLDSAQVAESMSIKRQNSAVYSKANMEGGIFSKLSESMDKYLDKKRKGNKLDDFLS
jgi:uncharacterized protein YegL